MNHGYARCSTNESKQDIDRQVRELKQAGAENIFLEYEHGDAVVKCQLSSLLEQAQAGDTIITLEVSRLARSTKQLCEIIEAIRAKRLRLVIVGSITVDMDLLEQAGILEYEKVQIVDVNNGSRFETYTIAGERGSGVMCLNGAAARMVQTGDKIILMAYAQVTPEEASELRPTVLFVDEKNKVTKVTNYEKHGEIG